MLQIHYTIIDNLEDKSHCLWEDGIYYERILNTTVWSAVLIHIIS